MKSKFTTDPQDGTLNPTADGANTNFFPASFFPAAGQSGGSPFAMSPEAILLKPFPIPPEESVQAQAAQNGPGGPGSVVAVVSATGFTINLQFDAAAMASTPAAAAFRAGVQQAAAILAATITDKISVTIAIDYSGTGGGAAAGPDTGAFVNYSTVRADLVNNASPGDTTFSKLPSSIVGQPQVAVWDAQLKLLGLALPSNYTGIDGSATFATDINPNLLVGVALHELTHALGRVPYGPQPDIFDLFRFTSTGTMLFSSANTAPAAYFSLDGGVTKIADFGQTSDPSDFLNSGIQGGNDPFNEFYTNSTLQVLTAADKEQLDALGYHIFSQASQSIVVAATASQALQGGAAVTLLSGAPTITDTASSTLSSATIKIANGSGNAVAGDLLYVNGVQNGSVGNGVTASWNASTHTLTLTGNASLAVYDALLSQISYQDTGTDSSTGSHPLRTITWTVNDGASSFGTTSQIAIDRAPVATVANVTLNTDFTNVAASSLLTASDPDGDAITTYAFKDTGHGHFFLNGVAQANNQEIDVTAAQLSQLTYQSSGGTDSVQVRVNDGTLWSPWQSFTVSGPVATVIQTDVSTSLVQVGSNYFLESTSGGTGPELSFNGAPVVAGAGQFSGWAPIGAVQTPTGYNVAWKDAATNQYSVWTTDSSGNFVSSTGAIAPTSTVLENYETALHQDLNGDGVIGIPPVLSATTSSIVASSPTVTADGSSTTTLTVTVEDASGHVVANTAVTLSASGSSNSFGTISGTTNANGVFTTTLASTLAQTETITATEGSVQEHTTVTFVAGAPSATTSSIVASSPTVTANGTSTTTLTVTVEDAHGNAVAGTAVTLSASGSANSFGTISGTTNANGVFTTTLASTLVQNETITATEGSVQEHTSVSFVALPVVTGTVIEAFGSTELVQVGSNYFLDSISTGTGPELMYQGSPVVPGAGQFSGWAAIGAEQTSTGYDVAWKDVATNQYSVWTTDSSGNFVSSTGAIAPTSTVLENYETALHQDLNGDGVIGIPSAAVTVIQTDVSTSLVQVGSNYFMYPVGGSSGPELSFNGAPVVAGAGQFSGWAPIGAVQTPTGYDVAWKDAATNQYSVWTTDSSGNFVSSTGAIAPTSTTLETYETTLHQDLNGDGFVGIPPAPVRSAASSSAVSQAVSVKIASSDTFIFGGGPGAGDVAPNTGTMGHDAWIAGGHPAAWMQETPASELLAQTHSMVEGHGTIINPGNHDGSAAMNFHFIDLHASHFII